MRVRQFQSFLNENQLLTPVAIEALQGLTIAVDTQVWLRSIPMLKDPFAEPLGGLSPNLFPVIQQALDFFIKNRITPIFVFDGILPPLQHQLFNQSASLESAWNAVYQGRDSEAQKHFALGTSRLNNEVASYVLEYLKSKNFRCVKAPYLASAQIASLVENKCCQAVYGQPGLVLYGNITRVITSFEKLEFFDLDQFLQYYQLNKDQFLDACLLAGTEYSLTFPYLNLEQNFQQGPVAFNFIGAIELARQAPLMNWMQNLPDDIREDHLEGYAVAKTLIMHCPVWNFRTQKVEPLQKGGPRDLRKVVGGKLPDSVYSLLAQGILSYRIPQSISTGEYHDRTAPLVDTQEYRSLAFELADYRAKAVALVANVTGTNAKVHFRSYFDTVGRTMPAVSPVSLLSFNVNKDNLAAEMKRQGTSVVDLSFVLRWHARDAEQRGDLLRPSRNGVKTDSPQVASALVLFRFLEALEYFTEDGGRTVLSDALKDVPSQYQEAGLIAVEMMKFGVLWGDVLEAPEGSPFPSVGYPSQNEPNTARLLARVASLVPAKMKTELWRGKVCLDLSGFHCLVRLTNRTVRMVLEGAEVNSLLKKTDLIAQRRPDLLVGTNTEEQTLPSFMLPLTVVGELTKFFIEFNGTLFEAGLKKAFPTVVDPLKDLINGLKFFKEIHRIVESISGQLDCADLKNAFDEANQLLEERKAKLHLSF
jgi:Temperature dependent protein affecting M2 dsRNA replication/XPG N-terminal domain